jgi:large subunit ribosomal protein L10
MATDKKIETVKELTDKVSKAKSMIFADYSGIKHKQLEELRRKLESVQGEFVVTKNKLFERSLGEKAKDTKEFLKNATATLFSYADEVAPLKELMKFFKAVNLGKVKGGLLGTSVLNESEVNKLATLPSKDLLLGKLVGQLNAPIQGLHYALSWNMNKLVWALNGIKEKKVN